MQEKLARRIASVDVKVLNPPRPGAKLLVLDSDYTFFDLNSSAERPEELARPFLHEMLACAFEAGWDLCIWSATSACATVAAAACTRGHGVVGVPPRKLEGIAGSPTAPPLLLLPCCPQA